MGKKRLSGEYVIPLLCSIAVLCPLRADELQGHSIRIEYFWTQLHKLSCGFSWSNAEILFPLGAFTLIVLALYFTYFAFRLLQPSILGLSICLLLHLLFRSFVDFYLITTYFPLNLGNYSQFCRYWAYPGFIYRLLAFIGGCASVIVIVFQSILLVKRVKISIGGHCKATGDNLSEAIR